MANSLIVPPYRAALLTNADGSPVVREDSANGPIATERQWYMFWRQLGDQLNTAAQQIEGLEGLVTYGNHLDRPNGAFQHDGALYVEQDRGSVIYQNQGGVWQYIAGIMYGTLTPDQRPTDLGPSADAGFQFRTTTDPARAFAWNGGQWVETTPIRYGTHAERLAETIANLVSGMLWMETDRGSVIYQNQGGTWLFLTGTMWGTLVPDQRPTDLGVHDAGFDFRTTVAPAREFIWNQVAWVEVTNISGATGLTHPNVVTKVGSVAGSIVEGGITDQSAANSNRLIITSSGDVGIGNSVATLPDAGTGVTRALVGSATGTGAGEIYICSNTGGGLIGRLSVANYAIAAAEKRIITLVATTDGAANSGALGIYTWSAGTAGERMHISSGGNIGLGLSGPTFQLQLSSDSAGKPATSTWSVVSDLRLKQNIEPCKDDSLAILGKLNWVRYEYNGQASTPRGLKAIGLVAQTVQVQLPEAVRSTKTKLNETDAGETDVLAIDYHHILVHTARAVQQLAAELQALRALIGKPA